MQKLTTKFRMPREKKTENVLDNNLTHDLWKI